MSKISEILKGFNKIKFNDKLKKIWTAQNIIAICTVINIFIAILQFGINNKLKYISENQEYQRSYNNKKNLRALCLEILNLSEPKEFQRNSTYSNMDRLRNIDKFLSDGYDNYLLIQDKESFKYWLKSINITDYYLDLNISRPYSYQGTDSVFTDSTFNIFLFKESENIHSNVLLVYNKLNLSIKKSIEELE